MAVDTPAPTRTLVADGATLFCSMGASAATLRILRAGRTDGGNALATVDDHEGGSQVASFAMCLSTQNPAVQSATAAAGGVFTPAPCVPVLNRRWSNGAPLIIDGAPALTSTSTCACAWAGTVSVVAANSDIAVP